MFWSWAFLVVTLVGAWFTFNAYVPHRRTGPFIVPSFFAGWLTSELSAHHFAWQLAATIFFIWVGALDAWPGQVGLGITLLSWAGLASLVPLARRSEPVVEASLAAGLGADYRSAILPEVALRMDVAGPATHSLNPFRFKHPDVEVKHDIAYLPDGDPKHRLDVYAPRVGVQNAPVLLQIHGGGWVIGNKREQALPLMYHLASRGWICVATNYRLSPRATFPDHLVDLKSAMHWIRENIAEYGGDPNFVAATGGSAGGHLSSLLALTAGDPEYQPGFESVDTSVRACVPFYGIYDFTNEYGLQAYSGLGGFVERTVMKKNQSEDRDAFRRASPLHRVHADAPPFFVIHGSHDSLASVEEARHFTDVLRKASHQPAIYAEIPGAQHAFEIFHSLRTTHVVRAVDRFLSFVYSDYLRRREAA
ncbi:MAG: alpha/beta hydrolase [Deltaproteobacteria bacterium]|nr:alpha/beta hydrolase [Deltaproteobacteria bacterium]MBW2397747.1 alpha/beta hydrolase [Deltaproteobacteria bacterium]MBW2665865.1 alpha/beta hydrolase [Deltaproteobacteria bacterium]